MTDFSKRKYQLLLEMKELVGRWYRKNLPKEVDARDVLRYMPEDQRVRTEQSHYASFATSHAAIYTPSSSAQHVKITQHKIMKFRKEYDIRISNKEQKKNCQKISLIIPS